MYEVLGSRGHQRVGGGTVEKLFTGWARVVFQLIPDMAESKAFLGGCDCRMKPNKTKPNDLPKGKLMEMWLNIRAPALFCMGPRIQFPHD